MQSLDTAIIVTTYQRPENLSRVLFSMAMQRGLLGGIEVIVADDGSQDQTSQVVDAFARVVDFPVRFVTHEHTGFHAARCRNEGVRASRAPYLFFLDGDCLIPPGHVAEHQRRRRRRTALASYCCYLDRDTSARVTTDAIRTAEFMVGAPRTELRSLAKMDWRSRYYNWVRHSTKPKMFSGDMSLWREDFVRINGFDEQFQGWGGEDDDLRLRLRRAGVSIRSILRWSRSYHLWHPSTPSRPGQIEQGKNCAYLSRRGRLTRCANGLTTRSLRDLRVQLVGRPARPDIAFTLLPPPWHVAPRHPSAPPEVEILFLPGRGRFSGRADCNVLVVLENCRRAARLVRDADIVVNNLRVPAGEQQLHSAKRQLQDAVASIMVRCDQTNGSAAGWGLACAPSREIRTTSPRLALPRSPTPQLGLDHNFATHQHPMN